MCCRPMYAQRVHLMRIQRKVVVATAVRVSSRQRNFLLIWTKCICNVHHGPQANMKADRAQKELTIFSGRSKMNMGSHQVQFWWSMNVLFVPWDFQLSSLQVLSYVGSEILCNVYPLLKFLPFCWYFFRSRVYPTFNSRFLLLTWNNVLVRTKHYKYQTNPPNLHWKQCRG